MVALVDQTAPAGRRLAHTLPSDVSAPSERKEGISIILDKVIVTNPVYGGGDYDDLDDEAPAPKSKSSSTEYDDEIPF